MSKDLNERKVTDLDKLISYKKLILCKLSNLLQLFAMFKTIICNHLISYYGFQPNLICRHFLKDHRHLYAISSDTQIHGYRRFTMPLTTVVASVIKSGNHIVKICLSAL